MKLLIYFLIPSFFLSSSTLAVPLDESWVLTINGQTVRPSQTGAFVIPNITTPDQFGVDGSGTAPDFISDDFFRLIGQRMVGRNVKYVWSSPFQIRNGQTYFFADSDLTFSDTPLVKPEYIRVTAPKTLLTTVGNAVQLAATAIYPDITPDPADNPTEDVTPRAKFTVYRSSNPAVLTVDKDGLATARGNGHAIVTAVNSLVSGSLEIIVDNSIPTTVEGIVRRSADQSPVVNAAINVEGFTGTTDDRGRFSITNVPSQGGSMIDVSVNGPPTATRSVTGIPDGITDAGIILLGTITNVGNEFIVLFERNYDAASVTQTLFATSAQDGFGTVESPALADPISFQLQAGGVTGQVISSALMVTSSDVIENKGIRIAADKPFQLYGLSQKQYTTDAYTAIPVPALGTRYRAMSYPSLGATSTSSQFAFVATKDGTSVTVTPTAASGARLAGVPYTITLDRLQTYQLQATTNGSDLTGSLLVADKPIAVFSGHACGYVPVDKPSCDHMIEQMPSTDTWGSGFITVSLASRNGGDVIRILADQDNTTIQVRGDTSIDAMLNAGQTKEFVGLGVTQITADKPVLVAQFSQGQSVDNVPSDPFMMLITPAAQFLNSYIFTTPVGTNINKHFVNVVAQTADVQGGTVLLDGVSVPAASFTAVPDSDYSAARLPIAAGNHQLSAVKAMGIYVYGFGEADSYGYPGGLGLQRVAP